MFTVGLFSSHTDPRRAGNIPAFFTTLPADQKEVKAVLCSCLININCFTELTADKHTPTTELVLNKFAFLFRSL